MTVFVVQIQVSPILCHHPEKLHSELESTRKNNIINIGLYCLCIGTYVGLYVCMYVVITSPIAIEEFGEYSHYKSVSKEFIRE